MEKDENKKRKDRIPSKKELLNNLNNQDNQKETAEKWVDLKYYKKETYQSHQILEKLSCEKIASGIAAEISYLSQEDYFKLIFKNINNEAITEKLNEKVYQTDKIISCNDLLKYPLKDQVQIIFKKASVLSYDIILNIIRVVDKEAAAAADKNTQKILGIESTKTQSKFSKENNNNKLTEKQALELILCYGQILKSGNLIYKSENKYDYVTDSVKREYMIKQRNTIIQFLQNNSKTGIKRNYFKGAKEEILNEILSESCECINGSYFLRESIFSNAKALEFKTNHNEFYLKAISFWQSFAYDTSILLSYVSDEQVLKQIEDLEITTENNNISHSAAPIGGQKRKQSFNYANSGALAAGRRDYSTKIKAPLALSRNNNSGRDLLMDSDYKIERMKDGGNDKLAVSSIYEDGFVGEKQQDENKMLMQIDDDQNKEATATVKVEHAYAEEETKNVGKKKSSLSDKNLIKFENVKISKGGKSDLGQQQAVKSEAGININSFILKESLLKNFIPDSTNKKSDILNSIYNEFPDLKNNPNAEETLNKLFCELFVEIRNNFFLKEIEDKEANKVWSTLLDMFLKGNSYKKGEIKKELTDKSIHITDQSLNKILKRLAVYTNSSWNLKE